MNSTRCFSLAIADHPQFTMLPEFISQLRHIAPSVDVRFRTLGLHLREELD